MFYIKDREGEKEKRSGEEVGTSNCRGPRTRVSGPIQAIIGGPNQGIKVGQIELSFPHEALELRPPGAFYTPSPRPYPEKLPELEYPAHFEKRYVSYNGGMRWKSNWVCVSRICQGAHIGLEEVDNEVWDVYFGPLRIGRFYERLMRIQDDAGRLFRHQKL